MATQGNPHPKRSAEMAQRDEHNNGPYVGNDNYCWECEATTNLDICFDCSAVYCITCAAQKKWHNTYHCEGCDKDSCSDCYEDVFYKTVTTHCMECREDWKEERKEKRRQLREEGEGEEIDDVDFVRNNKKE
jgi:hypothetical protein